MSRRLQPRRRRPRRLRTTLALAGALVVAEAAVRLLEPRRGLIEPLPVEASQHFTQDELDKARRFGRTQLALGLAGGAVQLGLFGWLAARPPRQLPRHPALAGAALSLTLTGVSLPLRAVARARARDVGLVTQSWSGWAADVVKSSAIEALLAGAATALPIALMRRLPRTWWLASAAGAVAVSAGFLYVGPVLLDPIFNRFTPLPPGQTRDDVLELARNAGVHVGEVYAMDASRRTTAVNAYVTGIGPTKRVVLFDTLLDDFPREEMRLVVAHELSHVAHRDVPNALRYLAIVAPAAMFALSRMQPRTVPALWLAAGAVAAPLSVISNRLSRRIEARADAFSLRLTDSPEPFVAFERRISLRNVSDPDPPRILHSLLGTHPTTVERIGIAKAYAAGAR